MCAICTILASFFLKKSRFFSNRKEIVESLCHYCQGISCWTLVQYSTTRFPDREASLSVERHDTRSLSFERQEARSTDRCFLPNKHDKKTRFIGRGQRALSHRNTRRNLRDRFNVAESIEREKRKWKAELTPIFFRYRVSLNRVNEISKAN